MMKPRVAVHKFSSCDGCQLAFLNAGEKLLTLSELVDIVHFAEAGAVDEDAKVDIAFVEGSVATPHELARIKKIRDNSATLITIGACATAGGIQALRNIQQSGDWVESIYARPEQIDLLPTSTPIAEHVKVDLQLWGCPITTDQLMTAIRSLLFGVSAVLSKEKVCQQCKRAQNVCVMVSEGLPCMGPVTQGGCGAICPTVGRDCYACFGPAEAANSEALANRFEGLGLLPEAVARRFLFINSHAQEFNETGLQRRESRDE